SICRRQAGLWGYYEPGKVKITARKGSIDRYVWGEKSLRLCRCAACGCVTHWLPTARASSLAGGRAAYSIDTAPHQVRTRQRCLCQPRRCTPLACYCALSRNPTRTPFSRCTAAYASCAIGTRRRGASARRQSGLSRFAKQMEQEGSGARLAIERA